MHAIVNFGRTIEYNDGYNVCVSDSAICYSIVEARKIQKTYGGIITDMNGKVCH